MELRHLRYFVVVAQELNVTRAAEKLFISQPPLTRQIRQLEDELEVQLFIRKPRGLELTQSGQYFLQQAQAILDQLNTSIEGVRQIASHQKTVFSIGFVPSVFYEELPLIVRRLRRNKNLEVSLHDLKAQEQIEALKSGKIDIGFGRVKVKDPEVAQETLFQEPLIAALPAKHQQSKQPTTLKQLARLPLITFPASKEPNFADFVLGIFYRQGLKVNVIQQVHDLQTALSLVASEMGFTLVPEQVQSMQREGVKFIGLADKNINTPLVVSRRRAAPPMLQCV